MFFKKKKETDADVLEKIKEKIAEDDNKQQATNESKAISDEDFLNDVLAEADVIEEQNKNDKIKQTQEDQKVLETINKVVQDAVNKNDSNNSQIKDANIDNSNLLDDLIKESDVGGDAGITAGQMQPLKSNNQQQDNDKNDLNSEDKDVFDDDLLDDVVDEDVSSDDETQNDSSHKLLEDSNGDTDDLEEDTVNDDNHEDNNFDYDLIEGDDNAEDDDNAGGNNDDDQKLLNDDEAGLDARQEDKNIGSKEIEKNTTQESEYQNVLHNDEDFIKTSKKKLSFPDINDDEELSHDERFDTDEVDNDKGNYIDNDVDSTTTKRRKNYELNSHVSDKTKSNVKGSITDLIESVKNQVLTSRQLLDKNSGSSKTLERFVADILRPQLIGYLDKNLDRIVKDIVRDEIQKIVDDVNNN